MGEKDALGKRGEGLGRGKNVLNSTQEREDGGEEGSEHPRHAFVDGDIRRNERK